MISRYVAPVPRQSLHRHSVRLQVDRTPSTQFTNSGVQSLRNAIPTAGLTDRTLEARDEGGAVCCRNRLLQTWSIALIMLATVEVAAQDKPDFPGRWILSTPQQSDTDIPLALSVRQTLVRTTVRGDPMEPFFREITIERQFETGTQSETHLIGVQGGTVSGRRADGSPTGLNTHHAVKWDENALVFESGSYTGPYPETGAWPERRETWSLEADGRLRVAITRRSSGDGSSTVTLLYRRP